MNLFLLEFLLKEDVSRSENNAFNNDHNFN